MNIPNLIRTKWNSNGAALVTISDSYCEECLKECCTNSEEEEVHQIISTCSLHSKYTTCYVSIFNVWELEHRNEPQKNKCSNEIQNFVGKTGVDSNHNNEDSKEEHCNTTHPSSEESHFGDKSSTEEEINENNVSENSCVDLQSENQANQSLNDSVNGKSNPWYAIFTPSWWLEIFLDKEFSRPWYVIFSPFWWLGYGIDNEISNENSIKKVEKKLVDYFMSAFKRRIAINCTPMFSSKSLHITKVKKYEDDRESYENLIKIEVNDTEEPESSRKVRIRYMSEEEIDNELYRDYISYLNDEEDDDDGSGSNLLGSPEAEKTTNSKSSNFLNSESWMSNSKIVFDEEKNQKIVPISYNEAPYSSKIKNIAKKFDVIRLCKDSVVDVPLDLPKELAKYWIQRYRLYLKYDENIKLDYDSWFSVTPEIIAAHQAYRCACDTVIDAFCGAGSNTIQLTYYCNRVIAIDIDSDKIEIARHNARVYGREDRIEFIQGDFFQLASSLKADVVMLAPPWGEINYEEEYDVLTLGGAMQCKLLFEAARKISPNITLYAPKNSNLLQLIELAGTNGKVDIEFDYISYKRKAITAYYGNLVDN